MQLICKNRNGSRARGACQREIANEYASKQAAPAAAEFRIRKPLDPSCAGDRIGLHGDEELNFTEDEARGWAHDPRNQEPRYRWALPLAIAAILGLVVLLAIFGDSVKGHAPPPPVYTEAGAGAAREASEGMDDRQEVKDREVPDRDPGTGSEHAAP